MTVRTNTIQNFNGTSAMAIDGAGRVTKPNNPSFRARTPGSGNVGTSGGLIIPFNSEYFDIGGNYNTSNYRFTAPISGTYMFCFCGFCNGGNNERISIRRNGSDVMGQNSNSTGTTDWTQTVIFYMSVNDYADVRCTYGGGTIYYATGHTEFAGCLIG